MLEQALRTYLLSKTPITALVKDRIHVGDFVPLKKEDMPSIGIETDPQERDQNIDGTAVSMQFPHFDIVVKALQFSTSLAIGDLIAKAFRGIALGASIAVTGAADPVLITQVDILGQWNDKEEESGHALTVKPRVIKIRVGWLEDTSTI